MKTVARVLALMLVLTLSCAALPASAGGFNFGGKPAATEAPAEVPQETPESVDITGCWELFAVDRTGGKPETDLENVGIKSMLLLYEDGTGYEAWRINQRYAINRITWEETDGILTVIPSSSGDPELYTLIDDQVIYIDASHALYFRKVSWPMDFRLKIVKAGKEDFQGAWEFRALDASAYGISAIVPSISFNLQYRMDITGDTMGLMQISDSDEGSRVFLFQADFEDGLLRVTPIPTEGQSSMNIKMYENGWISFGIQFGDKPATLFFARQPAEGEAPALPEPKSLVEIAKALAKSYNGSAADSSNTLSSPTSGELRYDGQYIYLWTDTDGKEMISIMQFSPDGKMMMLHYRANHDELERIRKNNTLESCAGDENIIFPYTFENGVMTIINTKYDYQEEYDLLDGVLLRSKSKHEVYNKHMAAFEYEEYVFMPFE